MMQSFKMAISNAISNKGVVVSYMKESLFIVHASQEEIKEGKFPLASVILTAWFSQGLAFLSKALGRAIEPTIFEVWGRPKGCIHSLTWLTSIPRVVPGTEQLISRWVLPRMG